VFPDRVRGDWLDCNLTVRQQWSESALEGLLLCALAIINFHKEINKKKNHPMNIKFSGRAVVETALVAPGYISTAIQGN